MKIKKKLEDLILYKFKNTKKVNEIKKYKEIKTITPEMKELIGFINNNRIQEEIKNIIHTILDWEIKVFMQQPFINRIRIAFSVLFRRWDFTHITFKKKGELK